MTRGPIVFGDDGSPHSDRAWLWITSQRWPGWDVDVLTAQPRRGDVVTDDLPLRLHPWDPPVARSADPACGLGQVQHLRSFSDPAEMLTSREDAALVVVGPRGAGGQARTLFLGSTADHLLHHPPAPLVIASTPNPAMRVLVATDGSETAQHAVETFAALPLADNAEAVWALGVDEDDVGVDATSEPGTIDRALADAVRVLAPTDPRPVRVRSDGDVPRRIAEQVQALEIDLLVLGTRGHTGLRRILLGSTCHALARSTPCPVLVVPPPTAT